MKKRILSLLLALTMTAGLAAGCGSGSGKETAGGNTETAGETGGTAAGSELETTKVRFNVGNSGNVLISIAKEKGFFEEEGLELEVVNTEANSDAMTMLATGKVDIVTNSGTSNPLQQIAAGVDFTIFGGHMVTGCMPLIAKAGTEWNGIEDFVGKKVAINPCYFAFTGALMDAGYEDPLTACEWITYTKYDDALAAVVRGEVDYALQGTGQTLTCKTMAENGELEIVAYQSDIMPNYSCCRMECQTEFIENNPNTIKAILRALIKAQAVYEADREVAVAIHASQIGAEEDYVSAYMLDDHYLVSTDPLKNSVIRAWNILDKTGFLDENAKQINIEEHINTSLFEEALAELTAEDDGTNAEFYERMQKFYEENDK